MILIILKVLKAVGPFFKFVIRQVCTKSKAVSRVLDSQINNRCWALGHRVDYTVETLKSNIK